MAMNLETTAAVTHSNLLVAWVWILLGFASGFALGLNFQRDDWLGGYGSYKRRLYRLAHISFFGLGFINLIFYLTARATLPATGLLKTASWGFIIGALSMPICCLIMAHRANWRALFLIPVSSLMTGGVLTIWEIAKL
jgi:hypothetical protein